MVGLGRSEDIFSPAPATPASVAVSVGTSEQLNVEDAIAKRLAKTKIEFRNVM